MNAAQAAVPTARQGEIWLTDLDPIQGREQAGRRPALVASVDQLGAGPSELCIIVALTTRDHGQRLHIPIPAGEGGLRRDGWILPEQVRSISRERLIERWGRVRIETLELVLSRVHLLTRAPS